MEIAVESLVLVNELIDDVMGVTDRWKTPEPAPRRPRPARNLEDKNIMKHIGAVHKTWNLTARVMHCFLVEDHLENVEVLFCPAMYFKVGMFFRATVLERFEDGRVGWV